jgi:hypothetical protein
MKTDKQFAKLAVGSMLLLTLSILATAENYNARAIRASAATVPTNIPGIRTYPDPPNGFNPITASDEDLASYGFPSRPDKQLHYDQYAQWERAMRTAKIRWNGDLKLVLAKGHATTHPAFSHLPEAVPPENELKQISTNSGGGVIVASGQKTFNNKSI